MENQTTWYQEKEQNNTRFKREITKRRMKEETQYIGNNFFDQKKNAYG